jgi:UDP:flavonoid glycosyltransferase YjiC (YdhE family)
LSNSTIKRIILATFGSRGDVHPYLAIAAGLKVRGHRPVIATAEQYRAVVEAAGIDFQPIRPDLPPPERMAEEFRQVMDARGGTKYFFEKLVLPSLRDSFEDLCAAVKSAALLVTHTTATAGPLVAACTGVPWVSCVVSPISFYSQVDPPRLPIAPGLAALPLLGCLWARALMPIVKKRLEPSFAPVARLRAELGLPPGEHPLFEGQHSPERVLALFSPLLATLQSDWPRQTWVTGFCFFGAGTTQTIAEEVTEFLHRGSPPIVFTLGDSTAYDPGEFFKESLAAVRKLGRRALFLSGGAPGVVASVSEEVAVVPYAPLEVVLPQAAALVHHGGIGTIGLGLRAGCPMLIMPRSHDQPDNAARAARLGSARILWRRGYRASRVAAELRKLLDDPAYRGVACDIGHRIRNENGVRAACDAIEARLG